LTLDLLDVKNFPLLIEHFMSKMPTVQIISELNTYTLLYSQASQRELFSK